MRLATFMLAMLGLLLVGTRLAVAQEWRANRPVLPQATAFWGGTTDTPGRMPAYRPIPGRYDYHRASRYRTYYQTGLWVFPPLAIGYYANPYPGYAYYPNGIGYRY